MSDSIKKTNVSSLKISEEVIEKITAQVISEIKGVYSLVVPNPKWAMKTKNIFSPNINKPIQVRYNSDNIEIYISVNLKYGYKIKNVSEEIQNNVRDAVQNMAGVTVSKVNVYVAGVTFVEKN